MICRKCPLKRNDGKQHFKDVPERYAEAHKRFHKEGPTTGRKRSLVAAENLRLNRVRRKQNRVS